MNRLTISLVTYNSERYLPDFCDSLLRQTFRDWDLIVIDNNSYDASVRIIMEKIPRAKIIRQKINIGFSRAHNLAITWTKTPYILVVNPDIVMKEDCIEQLLNAAERHPEAAELGGKLLYWDFNEKKITAVIDSFGLMMEKNYRVRDRFQGEKDRAIRPQHVFGISGALVLLRREALEAVLSTDTESSMTEYFDEDFFAYKEDVDIAWRFLLAGWKNYFTPSAIAYHHRSVSGTADRAERKKRVAINRYSYRNHLLMVYKNHFWRLTVKQLFPIIWFEVGKFFYLLFLDHSSVKGLLNALRLWSRYRLKRRAVIKNRRIDASEFAAWIS